VLSFDLLNNLIKLIDYLSIVYLISLIFPLPLLTLLLILILVMTCHSFKVLLECLCFPFHCRFSLSEELIVI
jgi:hypothetical protein